MFWLFPVQNPVGPTHHDSFLSEHVRVRLRGLLAVSDCAQQLCPLQPVGGLLHLEREPARPPALHLAPQHRLRLHARRHPALQPPHLSGIHWVSRLTIL